MKKFQFDKELIKDYGEQTYHWAKTKKTTIDDAALVMVYIARMCGVIAIDDGDIFYDVIVKSANKHGRVDKRSWHKQHP